MEERKLIVSSSPHVHSKMSTSAIMWKPFQSALIPAALWGIYAFGFRALFGDVGKYCECRWSRSGQLLRISKDASVKDG